MTPTLGLTFLVMCLASVPTILFGVACVFAALGIHHFRRNDYADPIYRKLSSYFVDEEE